MTIGNLLKPTRPDIPDGTQAYDAVRYGIGFQLRRDMQPESHVPERFRNLVSALESVERERKG